MICCSDNGIEATELEIINGPIDAEQSTEKGKQMHKKLRVKTQYSQTSEKLSFRHVLEFNF